MYGIYANIWGIVMVNVTIYSSTMDPMGNISVIFSQKFLRRTDGKIIAPRWAPWRRDRTPWPKPGYCAWLGDSVLDFPAGFFLMVSDRLGTNLDQSYMDTLVFWYQ